MKKRRVVNTKTGEAHSWEEKRFLSRNACLNSDLIESDPDEDNIIELQWWDEVIDIDLFKEAVQWCRENCKFLVYGNRISGCFGFQSKEDAMAFRLRWM